GDALDPVVQLGIEIVEGAECAGGEEGIAQVADGALDASFLISAGGGHRPWGKVVVACKLEQTGIETNDVPHALEHGGFQVVVEKAARHPSERGEGGVMAAEEALERLVENEAGEERSREGQHHHEARQPSTRVSDDDRAEAAPVDL